MEWGGKRGHGSEKDKFLCFLFQKNVYLSFFFFFGYPGSSLLRAYFL